MASETNDQVASIYIFSFSGFMLSGNLDTNLAQRVSRSGLHFDLQAPTRIARANWRPIPQLDQSSLERLFPGAPSNVPLLRVAVLPSLGETGEPGLQAFWDDNQPNEDLPKDTVVVVVRGDGHDARGEQLAKELLDQVFDWLRVLTRQWWIGRPSEAITGTLHTVIGLLEGDRIDGLPVGRSSQVSPDIGTRKVDTNIWLEAISNVRQAKSVSPEEILLSDASYFFFTHEYRTAMITACSLFEMLRDAVIRRRGLSKQTLKASDTDILRHVSRSFDDLFGRNLEREIPESFAFLRTCWIARGNVAHGKPLIWIQDGKQSDLSKLPSLQFTTEIRRIVEWLSSL